MKTTLRTLGSALLLSFVALSGPVGCEDVDTGDEQNVTEINGRFETYKGVDGQHYFQLLAKNGEKILRSEGYTSLSSAKKGISSVKKNGLLDDAFEVLEADNGEFYFNLVAANGEIIGTSELYTTKQSAEGGVDGVMNALTAKPTTGAASTSGAKFENFKGADGQSYFRLRAGNGEIVLQSEGYSSKSAADKAITSVRTNAIDAANFEIIEGANGQHTFRLKAGNGEIIARGEMYVSKSNAFRGAETVRRIVRELTKKTSVTDAQIQKEVERASEGLTYMSESDFPFEFVSGALPGGKVDEAAVRAAFASIVDSDENADGPLAELFAMEESWDEWKASEVGCQDPEDEIGMQQCMKMRSLENVLQSNLQDIKVFYFGSNGEPGSVDGTAVSLFIVGKSPSGKLVGVRTIAIWT
jgi:uncharacterized protein